MIILAFDSATVTGWASGAPGETPEFGSREFTSPGGNGEVLARFDAWVKAMIYRRKPGLVVFESPYVPRPTVRFVKAGTEPDFGNGPPPMNPKTLRRLLAMVGFIEAACSLMKIECLESTPAEITKHFTGRARWGSREAKKRETIRVCGLYGWVTADDNSADALALWHYAESQVDPVAASRRGAGRGLELALWGTPGAPAAGPVQTRIGRRTLS